MRAFVKIPVSKQVYGELVFKFRHKGIHFFQRYLQIHSFLKYDIEIKIVVLVINTILLARSFHSSAIMSCEKVKLYVHYFAKEKIAF